MAVVAADPAAPSAAFNADAVSGNGRYVAFTQFRPFPAVDTLFLYDTLTGATLRDTYYDAVRSLTFGLASVRGDSVVVGPVTLLRFGTPKVTRNAVDWPIEGGLLAGAAGGRWRLQASAGRVEATVTGYEPRLLK